MLLEESDNDDFVLFRGLKLRKVCKLVWEKSKLKNLKVKLDEVYLDGFSEKQCCVSVCLIRIEELFVWFCFINGFCWVIWIE